MVSSTQKDFQIVFMGKFDAYVLRRLTKIIQNSVVIDRLLLVTLWYTHCQVVSIWQVFSGSQYQNNFCISRWCFLPYQLFPNRKRAPRSKNSLGSQVKYIYTKSKSDWCYQKAMVKMYIVAICKQEEPPICYMFLKTI